MRLFLLLILCITVVYGRKGCRRLEHYDVEPPYSGYINRKPEFIEIERHGKDYTSIKCPNSAEKYVLIAEESGNMFEYKGDEFYNSAVLAVGSNVGFLVKCDDKKYTAETTDGREIRVEKVACVRIDEFDYI